MSAVIEKPRADRSAANQFEDTHLACRDCDPDRALCGTRRNGRPHRPLAEPTCVVCLGLRKHHFDDFGHCRRAA